MDNDTYQIFISYARPDREEAGEVFDDLSRRGLNPWIDYRKLVGGQNWDFEIKRALEKSELVVFVISGNSLDRRGYLQREIKFALDKHKEKLIDDIYIIPIILSEDISISNEFKHIHCIYASSSDFYDQLETAINLQIERLGGSRKEFQKEQDLSWSTGKIKEEWDGAPGYEVEIQTFDFTSSRYPNVREIGQYVRGVFLKDVFIHRMTKFDSPYRTFAEERWMRTNTLDASCSGPTIKDRALNLQYAVHWYGAGAAHPNYHFSTFCFVLEPLFLIDNLKIIFADHDVALQAIQSKCRLELRTELGADAIDDTIINGTTHWEDFNAFTFGDDGIEVLFAPYQVAGYAFGSSAVTLPYEDIVELMRPEFQTVLGIRHLARD
jgi:hypothetical protein